jgi:hypothetical protein
MQRSLQYRRLKALADQCRYVGVSLGDRSEHLPASARRLDVSDVDLQMAVGAERIIIADVGRGACLVGDGRTFTVHCVSGCP